MCECPHVLAGRDSDTCPPFLPSPSDPTPPPSPSYNCTACDVVTTPTQCATISESTTTATVGRSTEGNVDSNSPTTTAVGGENGGGTAGGNGSGDSTGPTVGGGSDGVGGVPGGTAGGNSGDSTDPMDYCTALGGGLGILSAVLAILLVGMVLGWVWSCRRRRGKSGIHER